MAPERGTLHFIAGRLAAGKTTLARRLAQQERAVFFCEDFWLSRLSDGIASFDDYLKWSRRCRSVMGPAIVDILQTGTSVVLDFAGNTISERNWVRSLFEQAGSPHVLHFLDTPEEDCLRRLAQRNHDRPEGLYFADTSAEEFALINRHFQPPSHSEGFLVVPHENDADG